MSGKLRSFRLTVMLVTSELKWYVIFQYGTLRRDLFCVIADGEHKVWTFMGHDGKTGTFRRPGEHLQGHTDRRLKTITVTIKPGRLGP